MFLLPCQRLALLLLTLGALVVAQPAQGIGEKTEPNPGKKTDVVGDALPEGALARMGTLRWRHGSAITLIGYTAKGKHVVTGGADGFYRVWDVTNGKEIRKFGKGTNEAKVNAVGGGGVMVWAGVGMGGMNALAPDGGVLAAQEADGAVRVWDVASGKEIVAVEAMKQGARNYGGNVSLVFTSDGKTLAIRGLDQAIRLVDVANGKAARVLVPAPDPNMGGIVRIGGINGKGLVFMPDGKSLVTSSIEVENQMVASYLRIYDVDSGKETGKIKAPDNNYVPGGMAASPDGKLLAWSRTTGVVLLEPGTGKEIRKLVQPNNPGYFGTLVFSPNGKILAGHQVSNSAAIMLWDVESGKELGQMGELAPQNFRVVANRNNYAGSQTIAFAPDSATLVESTINNTVRFWNIAARKEVKSADGGHHGGVEQLALSRDGKVLTTFAADRSLRQWDTATGEEKRRLDLPADVNSVVIAADGKLAASASTNNTLRLWDLAALNEGKTIKVNLQAQQGVVRFVGIGQGGGLALSPDSKILAFRGGDQTIRVYETASGKELPTLGDQPKIEQNGRVIMNYYGGSLPLAFNATGTGLATIHNPGGMGRFVGQPNAGATGNSLLMWTIPGKKPRTLESPTHQIRSLGFSADGRSIVTLKSDGTASLWDILSGKEYRTIKVKRDGPAAQPAQLAIQLRLAGLGMANAGSCMALSPDGRILAVGDKDIRLWDMTSGAELGKFTGHQGTVLSLVFGQDNKTLISGSADTTAMVWDASRLIKQEKAPAIAWTAQQQEDAWKDLAGEPAKAIKAMQLLDSDPKQAAAIFQDRLKPAVGVEVKRIDQLIVDLASDKFPIRKKASDELEKFGELAQPALETAHAKDPPLEVLRRLEKLLDKIHNDQAPPAAVQQAIRAVQVLEKSGAPEARKLMHSVARGAPGHRLTREAEAALKRLGEP